MTNAACSRFRVTVSTWKKSTASSPSAWARRNLRQESPCLVGGWIRCAQDPTEGGGRDAVAEAAQFALDPHDSPGRVLGGEAQDQPHHVVWCWWAARRFGLAPLAAISRRCQRSSV